MVWMQLGVVNEEVAQQAQEVGIPVEMDYEEHLTEQKMVYLGCLIAQRMVLPNSQCKGQGFQSSHLHQKIGVKVARMF